LQTDPNQNRRSKNTEREAGDRGKTTWAEGTLSGDIRPLPGSHPGEDTGIDGMQNLIIALKEVEPQPDEAPMGQYELYKTGLTQTAAFKRELEAWLEAERLSSQVAGIGEPTAFSLISLTSTPEVAERIGRLPDVEYVVPNSGEDFSIIK
jgi:hypothetical protein